MPKLNKQKVENVILHKYVLPVLSTLTVLILVAIGNYFIKMNTSVNTIGSEQKKIIEKQSIDSVKTERMETVIDTLIVGQARMEGILEGMARRNGMSHIEIGSINRKAQDKIVRMNNRQ